MNDVPYNLPLGPLQESGLGGADITIIEETNDQDMPVMDMKGNVLEIEHPDGSISISLDGRPIEEAEDRGAGNWFNNLVDKIDKDELSSITNNLLRDIKHDEDSRKEWMENIAQGVKLLGLKIDLPQSQGAVDGAPVEGMSKVRHPLLLEAVLRFQANARSEMLPTDGPVKIRNDSTNTTIEDQELADHFEKDFNHYLTITADEYYPDTDRMLFMLGFSGIAFKKVYFCPMRNRPVSESVEADDLIVSNNATTLKSAKRVTHRIMMSQNTVKRMQILGVYRDVELGSPSPTQLDPIKLQKDQVQGVSSSVDNSEDRDREILECYCELDIKGFEHKLKGKHTGLSVPYRVTIDTASKQVLSVVRNYDEVTKDMPVARQNFVCYIFIPGMGFYPIGLLHILGNTTNAITAAWREMLDAGMYASFPGFLYADAGGRQNSNIFRVPPGGGALIKTGGMPISQAVMPLPYKEPSQALMNLSENMSQYGQRLGGTAEMPVGEGKQEAPVGTTIALIEQATKVLSSVHKRMHSAQSLEFQLLAQCFRDNPESFWQFNDRPSRSWSQTEFEKALDMCDLVPQADPNTSSHVHRLMKVMALKQLQAANPNLYDPVAVDTAALKASGWDNPEQFMAPQDGSKGPPPEIMKGIEEIKIKKQDAESRSIVAKARAAELSSRAAANGSGGLAGPNGQPSQPSIEDQIKIADIQQKKQEMDQKTQDSVLDAINRKRDRESRERLAAMKFAEDAMQNPQGLAVANTIVDPAMLQRLETNEPALSPNAQGALE